MQKELDYPSKEDQRRASEAKEACKKKSFQSQSSLEQPHLFLPTIQRETTTKDK